MHLFLMPGATLAVLAHFASGQIAAIEVVLAGGAALFWFAFAALRLAGAREASIGNVSMIVLNAVLVGAAHGFILFPVILLVLRQQFSWQGYAVFALVLTAALVVAQALEYVEAQRRAPLARDGEDWPL